MAHITFTDMGNAQRQHIIDECHWLAYGEDLSDLGIAEPIAMNEPTLNGGIVTQTMDDFHKSLEQNGEAFEG